MPLSPGTRLGPYEILASLGAGGMGEVYRASDPRLQREVAIKVSKEEFGERFEREARAVAALNHPNICHLYDIGSNYLVMELVEGESPKGPQPPAQVLRIAEQIAAALEAAHEKGIVHRDLKPANIKITPDGIVKILDFGLAKVAGSSQNSEESLANSPTMVSAATQAGIILGTAAYMAPEQARGVAVDKRADIWAFGLIIYELLTGDAVFKGHTVSDTLASVIRDDPDWDKVPDRFRVLLRRCLEKDPKKRLRDIGDAMALMETGPVTSAEVSTPGSSRVPWLIAAACAALAAAIGVLHFRETPPAPPAVARFQIRLPDGVHFTSSGMVTLSPDGRHAAISASADGQRPAVWIQDLDAVEAHAFPGTFTGPNVPPFFWSPDSRFVVYSENSSKLKKADLQTGTLQDICDKPGPPIGGSWNKDGLIIFGSNTTGLWKVSAVGGQPAKLTVLDPSRHEREHELPSFLPDGHHFLYLRLSTAPDQSGIFAGSIDDPPDKQSKTRILATGFGAYYVPGPDSSPGWLMFLRDGNLMAQRFDPAKLELSGEASLVTQGAGTVFETGYFSASPNALVYRTSSSIRDYGMTWFDRQGKPAGQAGEPESIAGIHVSPDGTLVAYRRNSYNSDGGDLWLLDLKRDVSTRFTLGPRQSAAPVFSPDGSQIIFATQNEEVYDLYRKPTDGSKEEELLLKSNENKRPLSWSRDGRFLIYGVSKSITFSNADLWLLPLQGDHKPQPLLATRFDEDMAKFSPDGRWIAYESNESGRYEVYVREFVADPAPALRGKWIVSKDGGHNVRWRNDGKELVYISLDAEVMSVPVEPGNTFHTGTPQPLFRLPTGVDAYSPAPDFSRFLASVPVEPKGPQAFNVMLNWTGLLK
jgi:Tol biopolymer transport system component/predicted Ser/Thr protein kinase